jgi:heme oxygenase
MRKSIYQIEDDINAKLGGHRMHFKVEDERFGKQPGSLWHMEYAMSMAVSEYEKYKGEYEIYFTIFPWLKRKEFVVRVEVEPEKYQVHFSKMIKSTPGGNIFTDDIEKISSVVAKTMKRIQQWSKNPRPLY